MRIALLDGEPACGLSVFVVDTDAYVTFVATLEHARGRGLATRLLAHTLLEAAGGRCADDDARGLDRRRAGLRAHGLPLAVAPGDVRAPGLNRAAARADSAATQALCNAATAPSGAADTVGARHVRCPPRAA